MNQQRNPKQIFQEMLSIGPNPQQVEQIIFMRNPQLRVLSNQIRQSGMDPIQFALQYARQNNIPIQQGSLMSMYQEMMNMIPRN